MYVYQSPGGDAALAAPRDVVALARASARCGLFVVQPPPPDAGALVPGSAVLYRVNGGRWTLAARDCLPRRPLHLAISLFTDAAVPGAPPAVALLNPGPCFAYPPPSADELAAAAGCVEGNEDTPTLWLPAPRALSELGPSVEDWMAMREATAAPAEPEGEQGETQEAPPAECASIADSAAADGREDAAPSQLRGGDRYAVSLLAAAAAEAAARLGLASPPAA